MVLKSINEFEALSGVDAPTPAETALIAACRAGTICVLGDGTRPESDTPAHHIRAALLRLLRLLIIGGSNTFDLADRGVRLVGGWIDGELNLDFATGRGFTNLVNCHFTGEPQMNSTTLGSLNLAGSKLPGLFAQGLKVAQSVFLRDEFHATGTVDLNGADIGGQLDCTNGRFDGSDKKALNGQKTRIATSFIWRNVTIESGSVDLNGAHVGDLVDDLASWPEGDNALILDGFTYDRIVSFTNSKDRLEWLRCGTVWNGAFYPQPYVQLANTLRAQGHDREARRVSYEGEKLGRLYERKQMRIIPNGDISVRLKSLWADLKLGGFAFWDYLVRATVGYGLYPIRSVFALLILFAIATIPAHYAWEEGSMVPNSGPVLISAGWLDIAASKNPAEIWPRSDPGRDWETFNRYAWAADLVIPIIDLGQTSAWTPSTERGPWGYHLWWLRWVLIMAGWIVTALGAAAITGIIQRK